MNNINMDFPFQTLKDLYEKKNFSEAIDLLLANKDKLEKGVFHYNLGTFFAHQGKFAISRYHLERANAVGLESKLLKKNLLIVKEKLNLSQEIQVYSRIDKTGFILKDVSQNVYFSIGLFFFFIVLVSLLIKYKQKILVSTIAFVFCLITIGLYFITDQYYFNGVVISGGEVRSGPSGIYPVFMRLKDGQRVIVGSSFDGWLKIVLPRSQSGWIKKGNLGLY